MGPPEAADIRTVERRAVARARLSDAGIGAVVAERLGDDELRVRISDGVHFGWLVVTAIDGASADEIEAAVERRAANLPEAERLDALEALSPLAHSA
jgi:hypothetical protein